MAVKTTTKKAVRTAEAGANKADAKAAALAAFLKNQDKKTEEEGGPALLLSDTRSRGNIKTISTGAISLDVAIGGGIPRGRITEIYGPEAGGKTTLALTVGKNAQEEGDGTGVVGFVDAEHGLNQELCKNIGIDFSRFVHVAPNYGEQAIEKIEEMITSDAFDIIIVDSVAAMVPKQEIDAEVDQALMGAHARLMSRLCRRTTPLVAKHNVALVLLNQVRTALNEYGAPERSTGGKAIKFYASLRLEIKSNITSKDRKIEVNKKIVGQKVTATVRKNRLGAPGKVAEYDVIFGQGIEGSGSILAVAEELGVVTRAGASYVEVATAERFAIGKDVAKAVIKEDQELSDRLVAAIRARLDGETVVEQDDSEDLAAEVEAEAEEFNSDQD